MSGNLALVYDKIIMPAERVLQKIEDVGVNIDYGKLLEVRQDYSMKLIDKENELRKTLPRSVNWEVNWNSPKQVAEVLFKHCGLKPIKQTDSGQDSTGKGTLLRLVDAHPIPGILLDVRMYSKAISGFLDPWKEYLDYEIYHGRPGRLHSTYKIAETNTGRLSAEEPNLQQCSKDKNIRSLVCAKPGYVMIESDYSQIELRITAYVGRIHSMIRAYLNGEDLHVKTAMGVSKLPKEAITEILRKRAKAVNFGYIYGMWWRTFKDYAFDSYHVIYTDREAEQSRIDFMKTYPEIPEWHERAKNTARRNKCITNPLGRIRWLPNIDSPDKELRGKAERQAINTPVQNMASDMLLLSMIEIDEKIAPYGAYLVGEIHDALLAECPEEHAVTVAKIIKYEMEDVVNTLDRMFGITLDVPIIADVTIGSAWGVGQSLEKFSQSA